mgnify:CR=1 FL=1
MRTQMDSASDFSVSDLTKRKQIRRESKVEWSDRMLGSSQSQKLESSLAVSGNSGASNASALKDQFFSLLIDDSDSSHDPGLLKESNFGGTKNKFSLLNKQEEKKKSLEVSEYPISTQDFGEAKVEVQTTSNQILLVVHVEQFIPAQHTQILQRLVASRLGCQFGKNFEVQIKCKS